MDVVESLKTIEENHLGHFSYLPESLGIKVQKNNGTTVIDFNLNTSMFNLAYGAPHEFTPEAVDQVKRAFDGRPFAWWIPPTQRDPRLSQYLLSLEFICENAEHAMICTLNISIPTQRQK